MGGVGKGGRGGGEARSEFEFEARVEPVELEERDKYRKCAHGGRTLEPVQLTACGEVGRGWQEGEGSVGARAWSG